MHRREFLWTGLSAAAITGTATCEFSHASNAAPLPSRLRFMPHRGQFSRHTGDSLEAEFEFLAAHGFTAIEDRHLGKRPAAEQERFGSLAAAFGLDVGPFIATEDYRCANFGGLSSASRRSILREIDDAIDVAARTGARSFLLVLGRRDPSFTLPSQLVHARTLLEQCLARTESLGLTLLLEPTPIPTARAPMLIETLHDAVRLCRLIDHPRCLAVCDVYDWFAMDERNNLSDLTAFLRNHPRQIGQISLGDFPGRKEPGTGTVDFASLFEFLKSRNFDRLLSCDHGASRPGIDGEKDVLQRYSRERDRCLGSQRFPSTE